MTATNTFQTYSDIIHESWQRYCEQCHESSWFVSSEVHEAPNLRTLKKQSIEEALGDDIIPPKGIAFTQLKRPELFLPGIIVAEAGTVFEHEIKKEILSAAPYRLTEFRLRFNPSSKNSINYFMLSNGTYRNDAISEAERARLRNFAEDSIDLAILFADKEFRQVCDELSEFPKKIAERYVSDLNLKGRKSQ